MGFLLSLSTNYTHSHVCLTIAPDYRQTMAISSPCTSNFDHLAVRSTSSRLLSPLDQICQIKSHNRYIVHPTCHSIFLHGNRYFTRPHLQIHVLIVFAASVFRCKSCHLMIQQPTDFLYPTVHSLSRMSLESCMPRGEHPLFPLLQL